jgi:mitochondrial fission protein ELM1
LDDTNPDYIIASGQDAIPALVHLSKANEKIFSGKLEHVNRENRNEILICSKKTVYLGYPNIPFINFDQVVLPKYEANSRMGK